VPFLREFTGLFLSERRILGIWDIWGIRGIGLTWREALLFPDHVIVRSQNGSLLKTIEKS